tara:strand:- start:23 stop:415 length:393 start_codon:yes stop_codon:yes gene_type:complete
MNNKVSKKELSEFGILMGISLPIIFVFLLPFLFGHSIPYWIFFVSVPFILLGLFIPLALELPYKIWMKIGHVLGWINTRLILSLIFFLILFPISLIMKSLKHDPLRLKKSNKLSYRENRYDDIIDLDRIF